MINIAEKAATPATPDAGRLVIYAKASDGNLYVLNSNGIEVPLSEVVAATQIQTLANLILMGY